MSAPMPWERPDRTRIGLLRVRGGIGAADAARCVSGMLERVELRPPGLPPSALLIVRRMTDPLPGRVQAHRRFAAADPAWERAARDELARLYLRAARPARGSVPLDADAVVFADQSELLANLAHDLVTGGYRERWWWRNFSRSRPSLGRLLRDRAACVPAALALLARQGRAVEVVRALSAEEALGVLASVSEVHGVAASVVRTLSRPAQSVPGEADPPRSLGESGTRPALGETGAAGQPASGRPWRASMPPAPWSKTVPSGAVPVELDRARACLLGISLALHYRPEAVRSARFTQGLHSWWHSGPMAPAHRASDARPVSDVEPRGGEAAATNADLGGLRAAQRPPVETEVPPSSAPAAPPRPSDGVVSRPLDRVPSLATDMRDRALGASQRRPPAGDRERGSRHSPAGILKASPAAAGDQPADQNAVPTVAARGSTRRQAPAPPDRGPSGLAAEDVAVSRRDPAQYNIDGPSHGRVDAFPEPKLLLEGGVDTRLGGVLFLINAMCALDLPDCFEKDWRLASTVGAWGTLEALGRALLAGDGSDGETCENPIWMAFATLSGREPGERLGAGLPRRARYRLPAGWAGQAKDDADEPGMWAARGRGVRVWRRAGYVISETCRGSAETERTSVQALPRERFGDAPMATLAGPMTAGIDPAMRRWLALAVPFIRLRLVRALGIEPAADSLRGALLSRRGRLYVTPTHVDLVMRLDTVSLPVRRSGLDRSPGWLAEFGRVVLFHFE